MTHTDDFLGRRRVLEPRYHYEIFKHVYGQTTLKNHFFQKFFQQSMLRSEVLGSSNFHGKISMYSRIIDKILFKEHQ